MTLSPSELPTGRTAPPELTRGLKEVDPSAELIYMGDGRWDLLRLRPKNDVRLGVASMMLATAYRACQLGKLGEAGWYRALRFARLLREGYVVFGRYRLDHDPDWRIVHDFRRAMWEYAHDHNDEAIEHKWEWRDRKADQLRAKLGDMAFAREASRALRNPTTFTVNGLKAS